MVVACDQHVGRNLNNAKAVDVHELFFFRQRGSGHAGQLFVKAEVVLEGHRCQRHIFGLDGDAFFGFKRLVQAVGQAAARHHSACKFVDQHNVLTFDDVVFILNKQLVSQKRLIDVVHQCGAFRVIHGLAFGQQTSSVQFAFNLVDAFVR